MKLTPAEKDNKAELSVIAHLNKKPIAERRTFCDYIGLPWEEYERLLRKWSRVIVRWNQEKGGKL